jgi:hypothetical protein
MYQFNEQGMLKTLPKKQETYLTNLMLRRGLLSAGDSAFINLATLQSLVPRSFLSIKIKDSTAVDSLKLTMILILTFKESWQSLNKQIISVNK